MSELDLKDYLEDNKSWINSQGKLIKMPRI